VVARPTEEQRADTVTAMLRFVLVASAMTDPDKGPTSGGVIVLTAAAIVVIAGLCLFLLFRRGSIADRARTDVPDSTAPKTQSGESDQAGPEFDTAPDGPGPVPGAGSDLGAAPEHQPEVDDLSP
jgi:hypothetical protein